MPIPLLVVIPAGTAIAVAASGGTPNSVPAPTKAAPNGGAQLSAPSSGSSVGAGGMIVGVMQPSAAPSFLSKVRAQYQFVSQTNPIDLELQKKLDEIKSWSRAAYDKLSSGAKAAAAKALNEELGLDPPLKGNESFDDMLARVTAPAAAKAGAALGEAIGGPAGAALGQVVGKYLGGKLQDLLSKNSDDIKAWFSSRWADIESFVKDHVDDIEDTAQDVIDYLGSIF